MPIRSALRARVEAASWRGRRTSDHSHSAQGRVHFINALTRARVDEDELVLFRELRGVFNAAILMDDPRTRQTL
jgi:hypothetical protein